MIIKELSNQRNNSQKYSSCALAHTIDSNFVYCYSEICFKPFRLFLNPHINFFLSSIRKLFIRLLHVDNFMQIAMKEN